MRGNWPAIGGLPKKERKNAKDRQVLKEKLETQQKEEQGGVTLKTGKVGKERKPRDRFFIQGIRKKKKEATHAIQSASQGEERISWVQVSSLKEKNKKANNRRERKTDVKEVFYNKGTNLSKKTSNGEKKRRGCLMLEKRHRSRGRRVSSPRRGERKKGGGKERISGEKKRKKFSRKSVSGLHGSRGRQRGRA